MTNPLDKNKLYEKLRMSKETNQQIQRGFFFPVSHFSVSSGLFMFVVSPHAGRLDSSLLKLGISYFVD